jgi:hypothetical protein
LTKASPPVGASAGSAAVWMSGLPQGITASAKYRCGPRRKVLHICIFNRSDRIYELLVIKPSDPTEVQPASDTSSRTHAIRITNSFRAAYNRQGQRKICRQSSKLNGVGRFCSQSTSASISRNLAGLAHNHIGIGVFINGLLTIAAEYDFRHVDSLSAVFMRVRWIRAESGEAESAEHACSPHLNSADYLAQLNRFR